MSFEPFKPLGRYLMEAYYNWVIDHDGRCNIYIRGDSVKQEVLKHYINTDLGVLILNIGPDAVRHLQFAEEGVTCNMRFSGVEHAVAIKYLDIIGLGGPRQSGMVLPINFGAAFRGLDTSNVYLFQPEIQAEVNEADLQKNTSVKQSDEKVVYLHDRKKP